MHHTYIDEHQDIDSIIHRLEPRIKIISFATLLLCIIFTPPSSFISFALYALLLSVLILLSKIPIKFILQRSLVVVPFVLMISIFIPFIRQGRVAGGYSLGTLKLTLTYDGLMIFWNVTVKAYLSVLCMTLLITSTNFSDLLKALEKLKFPKVITMILSFMYRYIFVVQDELMKMRQAKESRTIGGSSWLHIKTLSNMMGVLFIRAYERAECVYLAMCSRGFNGKIHTIHDFRIAKRDLIFLITMIISLASIRLIGK